MKSTKKAAYFDKQWTDNKGKEKISIRIIDTPPWGESIEPDLFKFLVYKCVAFIIVYDVSSIGTFLVAKDILKTIRETSPQLNEDPKKKKSYLIGWK